MVVLNERQLTKFLEKIGRADIAKEIYDGPEFPKSTPKELREHIMNNTKKVIVTGEYRTFQKDGETYIEITIYKTYTVELSGITKESTQKKTYTGRIDPNLL